MDQVNLRLEHVRPARLHARAHRPLRRRPRRSSSARAASCGCTRATATRRAQREDPEAVLQQRVEIARSSGVPAEPLAALGGAAARGPGRLAGSSRPTAPLLPGVEMRSDLGAWLVVETPGHAPSHVCLSSPSGACSSPATTCSGGSRSTTTTATRRTRSASSCPRSTPSRRSAPRLCLPGHGRTFTDVTAHIEANRALVAERLERLEAALRETGPMTAFEAVPRVHGEADAEETAHWWLQETLCYLRHLEATGRGRARARRRRRPERWRAVDLSDVLPLRRCASTSCSPSRTGPCSRSSSSRRRPRRASATCSTRRASCARCGPTSCR